MYILPLAVCSYSVRPSARGISPTLIQPNPALYMTASSTLYTLVCFHIFHVLAPLAYLQRFSSSVQLTKRILAYKFTPLVVNNSRYNVTVAPIQGLNSSN